MTYDDFTWIWDQHGDHLYHAFKKSNPMSVCGKVNVEALTHKMIGAPECPDCLKVTGPDPEAESWDS